MEIKEENRHRMVFVYFFLSNSNYILQHHFLKRQDKRILYGLILFSLRFSWMNFLCFFCECGCAFEDFSKIRSQSHGRSRRRVQLDLVLRMILFLRLWLKNFRSIFFSVIIKCKTLQLFVWRREENHKFFIHQFFYCVVCVCFTSKMMIIMRELRVGRQGAIECVSLAALYIWIITIHWLILHSSS